MLARALEDSGPLLAHPFELLERLASSGACLLRRLLPPEDLVPLRAAVEGQLEVLGVREPDPAAYRRLFALPELHELIHHRTLREAMAVLLGTVEVLVHPRPALRVVPPGDGAGRGPTPAHQDLLGMQGSERALTFWLPLTDCPLELGPLVVAEGSHSRRRPYRARPGARVLTCADDDLEGSWAGADLAAGDVLVFHALTVHRALPNRSGRVRLSVDLRCQPAEDPVCEMTLREDPALPFEQLYAALAPDAAARAWRSMPLSVVPFDASVLSC